MEKRHQCRGPYEAYIKRPLDGILAVAGLIVLSPVLAAAAVMIRIKLGAPVLFVQERPGKDERIFKLYKFRTMSDKRDGSGELLPDSERLTGFGRGLRSASIDELPELFNIVKGDMSFVGPRPLVPQYLPYYRGEERRRHEVRPGLSGLAQIHGRNDLPWEERFRYDVAYIDRITFLGDVSIVLQTVWKVVKREHVHVRGEGGLPDFDVYRRSQEADGSGMEHEG